MFERFTDRAREIVRRARDEARSDGQQRPVGTEHLLLALLADEASLASRVLVEAGATADDLRARVRRHTEAGGAGFGDADAAALREIGIDLAAIVARVEEAFGPDALREALPEPRRRWGRRRRHSGGPFSPRSKKVLELSLREAIRLRHNHIGSEHILLGLLREGHGLAALVLTEAGVDLDDLRRRVEAALRTAA
ncbi:Clp protease N-terminal domain-containing protein [Micromonospora costi]|uniref:Clp protease n=1 Tax=Micromonospora costi TaxID=1530042 RepID=A0A3B0AAA5_9ACTN|nr:Clp protease N-terminal domain-containing protein [Micromonospora costi]RKN57708.1 Clp protease [Micromonospora costi]